MDNWALHHARDIKELFDSYHCSDSYLATYSSDFSPIELVFSEIKACVKALRPKETPKLIKAFEDDLFTVTTDDVKHSFRYCGFNFG